MKEPQKQFSQAKLANTRRKDRLFKKQNFLFGQNNLGDLIRRDWSFAFAFVLEVVDMLLRWKKYTHTPFFKIYK